MSGPAVPAPSDPYKGYREPALSALKRHGVTVWCEVVAETSKGRFEGLILPRSVTADPLHIVPRHLPPPPRGRTVVVGAGKAAASMARAVEEHWPKDKPLEGLVVTRYRHGLPLSRIEVLEAAHPVPDDAGEKAARRILELASTLSADDLLLVLVSGGGSALAGVGRTPSSVAIPPTLVAAKNSRRFIPSAPSSAR